MLDQLQVASLVINGSWIITKYGYKCPWNTPLRASFSTIVHTDGIPVCRLNTEGTDDLRNGNLQDLWSALEASPGMHIDVKRVILDESGIESEVRLEDEFFSALKEYERAQRGMWMREIQGVGKEKGDFCVSECFKCENPVDANVRALHVDKAGHIR